METYSIKQAQTEDDFRRCYFLQKGSIYVSGKNY